MASRAGCAFRALETLRPIRPARVRHTGQPLRSPCPDHCSARKLLRFPSQPFAARLTAEVQTEVKTNKKCIEDNGLPSPFPWPRKELRHKHDLARSPAFIPFLPAGPFRAVDGDFFFLFVFWELIELRKKTPALRRDVGGAASEKGALRSPAAALSGRKGWPIL